MKKTLFQRAHKLTAETVKIYGCDYRATFGASLKIVRAEMIDKLAAYSRKGYKAEYINGQISLTALPAFDFGANDQVIKVRAKGAFIAKNQRKTEAIQSREPLLPIDRRPAFVKQMYC